jgi:hypothetical protein
MYDEQVWIRLETKVCYGGIRRTSIVVVKGGILNSLLMSMSNLSWVMSSLLIPFLAYRLVISEMMFLDLLQGSR